MLDVAAARERGRCDGAGADARGWVLARTMRRKVALLSDGLHGVGDQDVLLEHDGLLETHHGHPDAEDDRRSGGRHDRTLV